MIQKTWLVSDFKSQTYMFNGYLESKESKIIQDFIVKNFSVKKINKYIYIKKKNMTFF